MDDYHSEHESDYSCDEDDVAEDDGIDVVSEPVFGSVETVEVESDESDFIQSDDESAEVDTVVNDDAQYEDEPEETLPQPEYIKELIVVNPDKRKTSHILSLLEMTEIISIRATDISKNRTCMVNAGNLSYPDKQAKKELMMRKCPLIVVREVGDALIDGVLHTYVEHWNPNEMTFATTYDD